MPHFSTILGADTLFLDNEFVNIGSNYLTADHYKKVLLPAQTVWKCRVVNIIKQCYIFCIVIIIEVRKIMKRFVEGASRQQSTLFPDQLDDYIA